MGNPNCWCYVDVDITPSESETHFRNHAVQNIDE